MPELATRFDEEALLERDVRGDFKHTLIEHGPRFVRQSVMQFGVAICIPARLDAVVKFRECDGADVQSLMC